jgi:hypothetical protein
MFLSKSSDRSTFHASINTSRLSSNIHLIGMVVKEINTLRHIALDAFTPFRLLAHWNGIINRGMNLRAIVNSSLLVWMRLHLLVIDILLLRKLCLIEASFSIESVLEEVSFLVELLIGVCSLYQVALLETIMVRACISFDVASPFALHGDS